MTKKIKMGVENIWYLVIIKILCIETWAIEQKTSIEGIYNINTDIKKEKIWRPMI